MVKSILPLNVSGATVRRMGKVLVGPVDLCLEGEGVTIVIGPNGAGKTSLLKLLHGLARQAEGRIDWACSAAEARTAQAFVFQTPVMMRRNVRDSIAYPLRLRGISRKASIAQAEAWAGRVGLSTALPRQANELSAGERQKLALARALISAPRLLFLDEPTANLDGRSTREIETILNAAVAEGTRILMATHNLGQARRLASEVVFLYRGKVHEHASVDAFFAAPITAEAQAFLKGDIVD